MSCLVQELFQTNPKVEQSFCNGVIRSVVVDEHHPVSSGVFVGLSVRVKRASSMFYPPIISNSVQVPKSCWLLGSSGHRFLHMKPEALFDSPEDSLSLDLSSTLFLLYLSFDSYVLFRVFVHVLFLQSNSLP